MVLILMVKVHHKTFCQYYKMRMSLDEEVELLTITAEECAEVAQVCAKAVRFGCEDHTLDNLEKEIGDLMCMVAYLAQYGLIDIDNMEDHVKAKAEKLLQYSKLEELEL